MRKCSTKFQRGRREENIVCNLKTGGHSIVLGRFSRLWYFKFILSAFSNKCSDHWKLVRNYLGKKSFQISHFLFIKIYKTVDRGKVIDIMCLNSLQHFMKPHVISFLKLVDL